MFATNEQIQAAFEKDGWKVVEKMEYEGKRGFIAENFTATNYETKSPKKAYYVEGSGKQIGYLMGLMAEADAEAMVTSYMKNVIPSMVDPSLEHFHLLCEAIVKFLELTSVVLRDLHPHDIPAIYIDEMKGLAAGCKASNSKTKVSYDKLWTLNTAIDLLLANYYTGLGTSELGKFLKKHVKGFKPSDIRTPLFCNGFAAFGEATRSKSDFYFSRNFMLTDAEVFQNTAAMTIYVPEDGFEGRDSSALISMGAPGFVGSIAAFSSRSVALGVDIVPAANCRPSRPGFNSLLLVRHAAQFATSGADALELIKQANRGVSWIYIVADGANETAQVIEAGMRTENVNPVDYLPEDLSALLPDKEFLTAHPSGVPINQGLAARGVEFTYPSAYLGFNQLLFEHFGKNYEPEDGGFIDKSYRDTNCPKSYYFAPTRIEKKSLIVTTNMYMVPEMRLCMMNWVTTELSEKPLSYMTARTNYDDIQWRYDELTHQLLDCYGDLTLESARNISSFLSPDGEFKNYYSKNQRSTDGKTCVVDGSVSLCNMKTLFVESHYGYYADQWVGLTLPAFVSTVSDKQ